MTVARTFDATLLNAVANDPDVRPWLLGSGAVDVTPLVENPVNVALECDEGGFVFVRGDSGDYDTHTIFPRGTGAAKEAALEAAEYMFVRTDCLRLTTRVPAANRPAAALAEFVGFVPLFHNPLTDTTHYELTLDRWSATNSSLETEGHWFHRTVEEAGVRIPPEPACEVHDRIVGAAVWMMSSGNAAKGLWLHNRWAAHAGYPAWSALSLNPPIINTGGAIVEIWPEDLEVLQCL